MLIYLPFSLVPQEQNQLFQSFRYYPRTIVATPTSRAIINKLYRIEKSSIFKRKRQKSLKLLKKMWNGTLKDLESRP